MSEKTALFVVLTNLISQEAKHVVRTTPPPRFFLNSCFHREVDHICILLGCYAVYRESSLLTFRKNFSRFKNLRFSVLEYVTDRLSRNVSQRLPCVISQTKADFNFVVLYMFIVHLYPPMSWILRTETQLDWHCKTKRLSCSEEFI